MAGGFGKKIPEPEKIEEKENKKEKVEEKKDVKEENLAKQSDLYFWMKAIFGSFLFVSSSLSLFLLFKYKKKFSN